MTKIHHTTAKKAAEQDVSLEVLEDFGVKATKDSSVVYHTDAKHALAWVLLAETLRREYPALQVISTDQIDETSKPYMPTIFYFPTSDILTFDSPEAPTLAEIQEACEQRGWNPEAEVAAEEVEEEETKGGGVVAARYKAEYAARGNPSHCGDWLADWLDGRFETEAFEYEGAGVGEKKVAASRFDYQAFAAFLVGNGVSMQGKWASLPTSGQAGWQGRYRMGGRQVLEKWIALSGRLLFDGQNVEVPEEFVAELRARHAKWLAKQPQPEEQALAA